MNRRFAGALGALSLGVVALLGSGSGAHAQEPNGAPAADGSGFEGCLKGDFCLFQHDNFDGKQLSTDVSLPSLSSVNFDNAASSMINGRSGSVEVFQLSNYGGTRYVARGSSNDKDFTNNGFDNKASSVRLG